MARLQNMPSLTIAQAQLNSFGIRWQISQNLPRTPPQSSSELGVLFDTAIGNSLAAMLGNIPVIMPGPNDLIPRQRDCVEVAPVRIIGGVRPQNFDVGYRPDGVRIAFDTKTLNDLKV